MDPITMALIASGVSTGVNALSNWSAGRRQNRETRRRENFLTPYLNQDFMARLQAPGSGFNTGQDALMQMLRAGPTSVAETNLNQLATTGSPFDTTEVFKTLTNLDDRQRKKALADVRATTGGLGQRFGSAMVREEGDILSQLLDQSSARNAQIAMGSHEAAQGRRLTATGQLNQREQLLAGIANMLSGNAVNAQSAGQNSQAQLLSLLFGQPMPQTFNPAPQIMDFAQMLLAFGDVQSRNRTGGTN